MIREIPLYFRIGTAYIKHYIKRNESIKLKKTVNKPLSMVIAVTERCNLKCKMCPFWRTRKEDELSFVEIKRLIDIAADWGIPMITFGGGEPLLRKDIFDILKYAKSKNLIIGIVTNGTLINYEIAEKLMSLNLFRIGISLDGANAKTHDSIRGVKGAFNKTLNALKILSEIKEIKKINTRIYINTVVMKENINEIVKIAKLAKRINVEFLFQVYAPAKTTTAELPNYSDIVKMVDEIKKLKKINGNIINPTLHLNHIRSVFNNEINTTKCTIGYDMLSIGSCGEVWLCQYLIFTPKGIVNNIRNKDVKKIWYSKEFNEIRQSLLNCKIKCGLNCFLPGSGLWFVYDYLLSMPLLKKIKKYM